MRKGIKKTIKSLSLIVAIVFLLLVLVVALLNNSSVQTFIIDRYTKSLSQKYNVDISVRKVNLKLFNRIVVEDILARDHNSDTLLYIPRTIVRFKENREKQEEFVISRIVFNMPYLAVTTDYDGVNNLSLFATKLQTAPNEGKSEKPKKPLSIPAIKIGEYEIIDGRVSMRNVGKKSKDDGTVDFNDLAVNDINLTVENIIHRDSINELSLTEFSFVEKSGFELKNISADISLVDTTLSLTSIKIATRTTAINIPETQISFCKKEGDSSPKFAVNIAESVISTADMAFFASTFNGVNETLVLSGNIDGSLNEFHGYDIAARINDRTALSMNVDIDGVGGAIDSTSFFADIRRLTADARDFEWLFADSAFIPISPIAHRLGTISVMGQFGGNGSQYTANSDITTDYGRLRADVALDRTSNESYSVEGSLLGKSLSLGHILDNSELFQHADFYVNVNGEISPQFDSYNGDIVGAIDSIGIKNYTYRNISLNGSLSENSWNGDVHIDEKNLKLDLLGLLDFNRQMPRFNFALAIDTASLFPLHIDTDSTSTASLMLEADFSGSNVHNLNGTVRLTDSHLFRNNTDLLIDTLSIETLSSDTLLTTTIESDFIEGKIEGYYDINELIMILTNAYRSLVPALFADKTTTPLRYDNNNLHFNAKLKNTNTINEFFATGVSTANDIIVSGSIYPDNSLSVIATIDTISYGGVVVDNFILSGNYYNSSAEVNIEGKSIQVPYLTSLENVALKLTALPDSVQLGILWDNKRELSRKGEIKVESRLTARDSLPTLLTVFIDSSKISSNGNIWNLKKSEIVIDTTSINFASLAAESGDKFYRLDGTISEKPSDTLFFDVSGLNLTPIDAIIRSLPRKRPKNPKAPYVNLRGYLSGNVKMTDIYTSPIVDGKVQIDKFSLLDTTYNLGTLLLQSSWNNEQKQLDISGANIVDSREVLNIDGYYAPSKKEVDIDITANHLSGIVLNTLLKSFATDVSGTVSGKLNFASRAKEMALTGALIAENTNLKVGITQVNYTVNDTVFFEKDRISLGRFEVVDSRGQTGYLSGGINHQMFANMKADVGVEVDNVMVFNTRAKDNPDIYGTVYATGVASIKTDGPYVELNVSALTNANTRVYIPMNSSAKKVSSYSFISFVDNKDDLSTPPKINNQIARNIKSGTKVNLDLNVTPDARIQLIFDPLTGDAITVSGAGDLTVNLLESGALQIFGSYTVSEGSYLFTMGNLLSKSFSVNEGGTISFNGDIENISMDIEAVYSTRASLYEILHDENYSQRLRVNCLLKISGSLTSPIVEFGIDLPEADSEVKSYLSSIISTEEELSKQFVYLLVMNSFYATSGDTNVTSASTSALSATTTEMLFNQVGNWLSQINEDFDVGFLYTPDNTNLNQQDFQVMLSTQLLDNRMTINGDFGYRSNSSIGAGNEHITGDFDIKYKLTDRIKLKAFNRYNSPYSGRRANSYTQGVGVFYEKDFDRVIELFQRK